MLQFLFKRNAQKGDSIVVGESFGRARSMINHLGEVLPKAGPSTPVQIFGLDNPPTPGDMLNVVKNEREAKKVVQNRVNEPEKRLLLQTVDQLYLLKTSFQWVLQKGLKRKSLI